MTPRRGVKQFITENRACGDFLSGRQALQRIKFFGNLTEIQFPQDL